MENDLNLICAGTKTKQDVLNDCLTQMKTVFEGVLRHKVGVIGL